MSNPGCPKCGSSPIWRERAELAWARTEKYAVALQRMRASLIVARMLLMQSRPRRSHIVNVIRIIDESIA